MPPLSVTVYFASPASGELGFNVARRVDEPQHDVALDAADELRGERTGARADVEHRPSRFDAGEVREPRRELPRVPPHQPAVGPGGAAERLGLKRTTLNSKIKKLGIERREYLS